MAVDAGTIYSEVRIDINKLNGDIRQIETRLNQFANKNKQKSTEVKNSWSNAFKQMNLAGVAAFAAIVMAVKGATTAFTSYEQSMANVRSVTDATAEDFKKLEDAAIAAGESTRFTATQAAEALYFLGSAGFSAKRSINALQGVLQLAGATQSDLASTSATMAATLAQFSLASTESTRVSNVFAAAIANSQATMEKLSLALKKVGPISGAFGISLEETTANLEALFTAGLTGQESGVALRNIMLGLTKETGPLIAKLKELGIAFEDVNPQEVGLTDAIQTLAESGVDLAQVFETRTVAAILSLAETGGPALRQLEADITDTNRAAEMYAIQNDTLAGSMDFFKSAMESASIKLTKEFAPAIRGVVDFLTDAIRAFNGLPGPIKIAIVALATIGPAIAAISAAVALLSASFGGISAALMVLGGAVALTGVLHRMQDITREAKLVNSFLERAVANGEDLNEKMVEMARVTGKSLEEIKDIVRENDNINESLLIQDELNQDIVDKYTRRIELLETELELNAELLVSQGISGFLYRAQLEIILGILEARKQARAVLEAEIELRKEQEEAERIRLEKEKKRLDDLADLQEEFRRLQLTEEQRAIEDLETDRDKYMEGGIETEEWYQQELAAIREKYAEEESGEKKEAERIRLENEKINLQKLVEIQEEFRREQLTAEERAREDLEIRRAELLLAGIDDEIWYQEQLAAIREQFRKEEKEKEEREDPRAEQREKEIADTKTLIELKDRYQQKLESLKQTAIEQLEADRERTIEEIKNSDATKEAKDEAIKAVKEYYDLLIDNTANAIFQDTFMSMIDTVLSGFSGLFSALSALSAALTANRIADLDAWLQAELEAAGLVEETTLERLQRELDAAIAAGDSETADKLRQDLLREQIEEDYQKKLAQIKYEGELKQWKYTLAIGIASAASAILSGYASKPFLPVGLLAGILATAKSGIQIAAIKAQEPKPPAAATGGLVLPSSTGGTLINTAENRAPELLLNGGASGEAFLNGFAQRIADIINAGNGNGITIPVHLYIDGKKVAESSAKYYNKGIVRIDL
ncbi:hypothetical protein LCGC14_0502940 [marine sediment metagenome]|uniref:Phage tail tape measure protein domain-containing protein n=1 Tax=marine sediment metagenome TaxID=412755 RepID=A0A0F9UQB2_9ZZZZ